MSTHGVESSIVVFAVSVLISGLAIHVGATFALTSRDYSHAVLTAILGGLAWALVSYALGSVGVSGRLSSVVGLVVWVWLVGRRYGVGWLRAGVIGVVAWIAALVALGVLASFGVASLGAYGVPGT